MIKFRYTGPAGVRTIDPYQWCQENQYVTGVDPELAAALITYPHPDQFELVNGQAISADDRALLADRLGVTEAEVDLLFEIAPEGPMLELTEITGIGPVRASELSEQGVATVEDLAGQDEEGIERLATNTGASRGEIVAWVAQAQSLIHGGN